MRTAEITEVLKPHRPVDSLGQELSFSGPQGGAAGPERADRPVIQLELTAARFGLGVEDVRVLNSGLEKLFQARTSAGSHTWTARCCLAAWSGEVVCLRPDPYIEFPFPRALMYARHLVNINFFFVRFTVLNLQNRPTEAYSNPPKVTQRQEPSPAWLWSLNSGTCPVAPGRCQSLGVGIDIPGPGQDHNPLCLLSPGLMVCNRCDGGCSGPGEGGQLCHQRCQVPRAAHV